jgi:hypothetical protein
MSSKSQQGWTQVEEWGTKAKKKKMGGGGGGGIKKKNYSLIFFWNWGDQWRMENIY